MSTPGDTPLTRIRTALSRARARLTGTGSTGILPGWIDRAVVVSLPESGDRRSRIASYLPQAGLPRFDFFDASGPDSPEVRALYDGGLVQSYPPCFRCGKLTCGSDLCNNVLIAPQVANVVTFRRLWRDIAARGEVTLVMEDDIVLQPWAATGFDWLGQECEAGRLVLGPGAVGLLRLGWGMGPDHDAATPFQLSSERRMSNPMYLVTPDFAARAAALPEAVTTTSDITLHRIAPAAGQALTLLPPLGSELSASTGALDSTIHPKRAHARFLAEQGDEDAAKAHRRKVRRHRDHIYFRPLLITGHPRTGTGLAAELCRQAGLDVGHEDNGADGLSSWMMAADADENPWAAHPVARSRRSFHCLHVVQTVRDPATALPSILREDEHAPASLAFRRRHILAATGIDLDTAASALDRAALSLCLWARMIAPADHVFRVEDGAPALLAFLRGTDLPVRPDAVLDPAPVNADKLYKGKRYPKPEVGPQDWAALPPSTLDLLRDYCVRYGYAPPLVT